MQILILKLNVVVKCSVPSPLKPSGPLTLVQPAHSTYSLVLWGGLLIPDMLAHYGWVSSVFITTSPVTKILFKF